MDKETYETYEFLPTNNVGQEHDQFLIVQDDGTFLITKQIQCVAQEQVKKEIPVGPVSGFDVQPQQYYVNVNNSTELIVPEQLILPNGSNNLYTNSYLLKTESVNTITQQGENVVTDQQTNTEVAIEMSNKQANNCTEITLSDEQYHTLEQKGWILLESNDKIFVLDTLGLHDITSNDKLIHKLRNEIQNDSNVEMNSGCIAEVVPNASQDVTMKGPVQFIVASDENIQNGQNVCFVVDKGDGPEQEDIDYKKPPQSPNSCVQDETIEVFREQDSNSIKIKTKFVFANIPNKIILGKTATGKRIVAKVIKKSKPEAVTENIVQNKQPSTGGSNISETKFLALVHEALKSHSETYNTEDVASANTAIQQLLKLPSLRQTIVGQNIIVTKVKTSKAKNNKESQSTASLVTGKINSSDSQECFTHIPDLLHSLLLRKDASSNKPTVAQTTLIGNDVVIFHIHVTEIISEDNDVRVHINLAKRQFATDYKLRKPVKTYACGACATLFPTEEHLKHHQQCQCMETEDNLFIDIDVLNKNKETYSMVKIGKEKFYSCLQCDAKIARLSHFQKHVKTHFGPNSPMNSEAELVNSEQTNVKKEREVYKCKMCPARFYHQSTLSRHIFGKHIKLRSK